MAEVDELTEGGQPVDGAAQTAEWLSVSDLARRLGKSKQAISKRLKSLGDMVAQKREGSELLVNVSDYERATRATQDPSQALRNPGLDLGDQPPPPPPAADDASAAEEPAAPGQGASYQRNRALREGYEAENSRLDLLERIKQTCDRSEVEARTFSVFRQLRDRLLSLPATTAAAIMSATDERAVRAVLDDAIRDLLDQFASDLDRAGAEGVMDIDSAVDAPADADPLGNSQRV